jgi:integrase
VNAYIASRRGQGVGPGTINRETSLLRSMYHHGTRATPPMVERIPAFPVKLKEPPARKNFVTDVEYAVLAANARELWLRALIATAYATGARKSELLNLRVNQVDGKWIELPDGSTKNGEARKIPMTGEVFQLLSACIAGKKPDDYVFTREAGSRVVDPREEWYSLCVSSGLGQLDSGPAQER